LPSSDLAMKSRFHFMTRFRPAYPPARGAPAGQPRRRAAAAPAGTLGR